MQIIKILFILLISFNSLTIFSQSKDTANKSSKKIWTGYISLGGLFQSGNTNKISVLGKGELRRDDKKLETVLYASYLYGTRNGLKDNNNLIASFTADYIHENFLSPFLLQVIEYDYSKGIDLRSQSGAGAKYTFIPDKDNKSSVSLAIIYDYTNLAENPKGYADNSTRFSFRLKTKQILLDSHLTVSAVGYFQPKYNDFSENNQRVEVNISIPIVNNFSFNTNYIYSLDNVVSVGRKRADNILTFSLKYEF